MKVSGLDATPAAPPILTTPTVKPLLQVPKYLKPLVELSTRYQALESQDAMDQAEPPVNPEEDEQVITLKRRIAYLEQDGAEEELVNPFKTRLREQMEQLQSGSQPAAQVSAIDVSLGVA